MAEERILPLEPVMSRLDPGQISGLDGLRAISVLIVIAGHFNIPIGLTPGFGVTIFFFISGYLITWLLLKEVDRDGTVSLPNFYIRRFLRLMPALGFMVLGTFALYRAFDLPSPLRELPPAVFYYQNYYALYLREGVQQLPYGVLWSLAVEEHYYLLYPALLLAFRNRAWGFAVSLALVIVLINPWRAVFVYVIENPGHVYSATDTRIDSILWGALLAALARLEAGKRLIGLAGHPVAVLIGVGVIAFTFLEPGSPGMIVYRYFLRGFGLFAIFAGVLFSRRLIQVHRILELAPLRWTGRISYPLYLWHAVVLSFWFAEVGDEAATPTRWVALAASFGIAAFSYYAIERQFRGLRRRFGGSVRSGHLPSARTPA